MSTTTETVTVVNADFEKLAKYENVMLKCPGMNDKHFKLIPGHSISVNEEVIQISKHYRRGDFIDQRIVTKHFFVNENHFNKSIVAKVELVEKTDNARNGEKTFLLNITPNETSVRPTWRLKIGTDKKSDTSYQIPGTEKFVSFEPVS